MNHINPTVFLLAAWLLDVLLGEPRKWHPLVLFGNYARRIEYLLYRPNTSRIDGIVALALALLPAFPFALIAYFAHSWLYACIALLSIYMATAYRALCEHARDIALALEQHNLESAREKLARIVSRDTSALSETEICSACIESVLENGNDAIFAAWFWWLIAGIPGVVVYRLTNTLDAMWGYKTQRYHQFGWAAARLDDLLNYLPARTTAFCYCLAGNWQTGWHSWQQQGKNWKSPNAGPVMAAGAGSLGIQLGGTAAYAGRQEQRPLLGVGDSAVKEDISRALRLLRDAVWLWWFAALGLSMLLNYVIKG